MSLWNWVSERYRIAQMEQDSNMIAMCRLFYTALDVMQRSPDEALMLLQKSRELAESMQDAWWVELIHHWELQTRMCYKMDYNGTAELATKALEETRKQFFRKFPQRTCLHEDLITSYLRQDPHGYRRQIEEAIASMEESVSPKLDCYQCFHDLKTDFAIQTATPEQMLAEGLRYLHVSEENDHYSASAYGYLCTIAHKRGEWEPLAEYAKQAEDRARRAELDYLIPTAYLWQAVVAQHNGDVPLAQQAAMNATTLAQQFPTSQRSEYYDALCVYHEEGGRLDEVLKTRERQLQRVLGRAQRHTEAQCRAEIFRLRKALGLPSGDALQEARAAASTLKNPAPLLERIAAYEGGT
ncbi:MAG: hypothetical protein U0694_15085 [Anaerolineae bacterium]